MCSRSTSRSDRKQGGRDELAKFSDPGFGEPFAKFSGPPFAPDLTLELPGYRPASPNTMRGRHWSVIADARDKARIALTKARLLAGVEVFRAPRAPKFSRWLMHLHCVRARELDPDNLGASLKQLIDACVDAGMISGDSAKVFRPSYSQECARDGKRHGVTIHLKRWD